MTTSPIRTALEARPRTLAIFLGPHDNVSPSWLEDRTQAPRWKYALAHLEIDVTFDGSAAATCKAIAAWKPVVGDPGR